MLATWEEGNIRPRRMMERLCRLLICLVNQLTLLFLSFRLLLCRVINLIVPIWIRQRHGCTPALLELSSPSRLPDDAQVNRIVESTRSAVDLKESPDFLD